MAQSGAEAAYGNDEIVAHVAEVGTWEVERGATIANADVGGGHGGACVGNRHAALQSVGLGDD